MQDDWDRKVDEERRRVGLDQSQEEQPEPQKLRGPRMPGGREKWVTLPDPYEDMRIRLWINYPNRLNDDLASGDDDLIYGALAQIVLEHNDWHDEDGDPLPVLSRGNVDQMRKFWRTIPNECAQVISTLIGTEVGKASASLTNRQQRRGR